MLISIEGIDGAGKNTLVSALKESLDRPVEVIAFPRYADSIHAQLAQKALYGKMGDLTDSAYAMATLFALDRYGVKDQLQRAKESDTVVLLDRYVASNAAYSAARLEDDAVMEWVHDLEFGTLSLPQADLQVYLDTAVEVASERAQARAQPGTRPLRARWRVARTHRRGLPAPSGCGLGWTLDRYRRCGYYYFSDKRPCRRIKRGAQDFGCR